MAFRTRNTHHVELEEESLRWPPWMEPHGRPEASHFSPVSDAGVVIAKLRSVLRAMGVMKASISHNLPYSVLLPSNWSEFYEIRRLASPIVIWFELNDMEYAVACDSWNIPLDNLRGCLKFLESFWLVDRAGVPFDIGLMLVFMAGIDQPHYYKYAYSESRRKPKEESQKEEPRFRPAEPHPSGYPKKNADDHWKIILEVRGNPTLEEIKKSYKRLAFIYHPDKRLPDDGSMSAITIAWAQVQRLYSD